tara:strand:+ start:953 stop:1123 length:171 start_codon:yes stop_codon:yes gene_type:complete
MLTLVPCYEYVVSERDDVTVYYTGDLRKATEMKRLLDDGTTKDPEVTLERVETGGA